MAKRRKLKKATAEGPKAATIIDLIPPDIPKNVEGALVEMDNPLYQGVDNAERDHKGDWKAGQRERVRMVISFKHDPISRMFARKQIEEAEHKAAVALQVLHGQAQIGAIRAIDPFKDVVDGGQLPEVLTDSQQRAIRRIRSIEKSISLKHGLEGLALLNGVVVGKMTVEQYVSIYALDFLNKLEFWRCLFRKCLWSLAREMGTIRGAAA